MDSGPGIADLDRMGRDGVSTSGSSGTGLGAIMRLSDAHDVHTSPEGTVIAARLRGARAAPGPGLDLAALLDRYPGADVCGDGWGLREVEGALMLLVCDGLGHGRGAHEATQAVRDAFAAQAEASPASSLAGLSDAAARTRGAVAMVLRAEADGALTYAGLGNISGLIASRHGTRRLMGRDGRLGAATRRPSEQPEALARGETLIVHSDSIRTLRDMERRSGLLARWPLTVAAVLLRDHARGNDDAGVLVLRG